MLLLYGTITLSLYLLFFKKVGLVLQINYPTCIENFNISFFKTFNFPNFLHKSLLRIFQTYPLKTCNPFHVKLIYTCSTANFKLHVTKMYRLKIP